MAVISFDLVSVLIWPMTRPPFSEHHAESMCKGDAAVARSKDAFTGLAVQRDEHPLRELGHRPRPGQKALLKALGIETSKHPAEGIMRGNPMRQGKERLEPCLLALAKEFHILESFPASQEGAQGNDQDIEQRYASSSAQYVGPLRSENARRSTR